MTLETPVSDGAGVAVFALEVGLGDVGVAADHFEAGVADEVLEDVDVAAVAQEFDGEGVAEAVGVDVGDASTLPEALEVLGEVATFDGVAVAGGEEGLLGVGGEVGDGAIR